MPAALLVLLAALVMAGCGADSRGGGGDGTPQPSLGVKGDEEQAAQDLGFPAFATKNTTRVGGADPVAVAAGAARAVFPAVSAGSRPEAVALVPSGDWRAAVAAAVLMSEPIRAPMLLSGAEELPAASEDALAALRPKGSGEAGDAQVIRVGDVARPEGLRSTDLRAANPFGMARAIDAFHAAARGAPSEHVLIVSAEAPAFALPAAAWAAKSGDPVLFVQRDRVPPETRAALAAHRQPRIYVLGPSDVISPRVTRELRRLGTVKRVGGRRPVTNAISFARFLDGTFGWGVVDPGHGLVFTGTEDPLLAAAASPLSASGTYGPLIYTGGRGIAREVEQYLLDIQPGFERDPVRGVYNKGWIIGDEQAITIEAQGRLDELLEIVRVRTEAPPGPEPEADPPAATTPTTPTTPAPTGTTPPAPAQTATTPTRTSPLTTTPLP
jgi:hypothetical protein